MTAFWLGTHRPNWLGLTDVPLFVSHRTLVGRKSLPRALGPWALDSGGFSEIHLHGGWNTLAGEYSRAMRRYRYEIGNLAWASPCDWMCEPSALKATGLTVFDHQVRTIDSVINLRFIDPSLPVIPVLQGWHPWQYEAHVEMYAMRGIRLTDEPLVGLGTVCRRQNTGVLSRILDRLPGLRLHAFGVKLSGLRSDGYRLASTDSMAWSYRARRSEPLLGCTHANCANCLKYALQWRERLLDMPMQSRLELGAA